MPATAVLPKRFPPEDAGAASIKGAVLPTGLISGAELMSLKFTAGDLTIHRIIEQETTFLPALEMLPSLTPEILAENRSWMKQAKAIDDTDTLITTPS
jgi:hypothetical protein